MSSRIMSRACAASGVIACCLSAHAQELPADAPSQAAPAQSAAPANSMTAFNPAMSVILSGIYTATSQDPADFHWAGFFPAGDETGPGERGFNLGESELTLSANIDSYFYGQFTAALDSENEIGVEEAFFRTAALPDGFTLKGGRFFSGVGYLNEIHAHAWDFVDQPLAYQAFLGGQLGQDGAQLKWLAPTVVFVEVGAEAGNGQEFPGTRLNKNSPNGFAAFIHVGNDIGDSSSWRAGVSYLERKAEERSYLSADDTGAPVVDAFTGRSKLWVADAVWKWAPHGNPVDRYLKVQGEYMKRRERGSLAFDIEGANLDGPYAADQSGWYVQSVYQFQRRWRAGVRYDRLDSGNPDIGLITAGDVAAGALPELLAGTPERTTVMLDFSPSEFSRIRAQYALDDSRGGKDDRQVFVQYLYSIGAHGAHKY